MISLFLDTSTNVFNTVLLKDNKVIDSFTKEYDKDLSKEALFRIKEMLDKNNLKPNDLDEIVCVRGPGSFTGLRIGVTIAKTIAYFLNKNLYSVSSLEVMATSTKGKVIVPIIDARRGYVYAAVYNDNYNTLMEEAYIKKEELDKIAKTFSNDITYVENDFTSNIVLLYKCSFKKEENPINFEPNYLKKPEAEEKLNDSQSS